MATPTGDTYVVPSNSSIRGGRNSSAPSPTSTGKYRFQNELLFQRAPRKFEQAKYINSLGQEVLIPGQDLHYNRYNVTGFSGTQSYGSDPNVLCVASRWKWKNTSGDWLDSTLTAQGSSAWVASPSITAKSVPGEIVLNVTDLVKYCDQNKLWYAFLLKPDSGIVNLVGPLNPTLTKSVLEITRNGVVETKQLWYAASMRGGTAQLNAQDDNIECTNSYRGLVEFFRSKADQEVVATSATLRLTYANIIGTAVVKVFLVNPQIPSSLAAIPGIAQNYPLDAGIFSHPSVAAALRVTDTTVMDDILDGNLVGGYGRPWDGTHNIGTREEYNFDPNLWGVPGGPELPAVTNPSPAALNNLLPRKTMTAEGTKMVGMAAKSNVVGDTVRVVHSDEIIMRGFTPLAPGMGALEMTYHGCNILGGQATAQSLTTGGPFADDVPSNDLEMFFKPEHIGRVVDGYMRMHIMLAEGWQPVSGTIQWNWFDTTNLGKWPEQITPAPTSFQWRPTDTSGKFPGGIQHITLWSPVAVPNFPTRLNTSGQVDTSTKVELAGGGYSSTSGIYGYQGRWVFNQGLSEPGFPGGCVGGARLGIELYDFAQNSMCIPSQAGLGAWETDWRAFPHIGGLGFYQHRKWYSIEMRWKLNTITFPYQEPPIGTHFMESGFLVDGFLEWWVDGIYAGKSPNHATRTSRMIDWALQNSRNKPFGTPNSFRPMTGVPDEFYMGATTAVLQTYYGGRSPNPRDMKVLVNGVVVSNGEYIGPMKGVSRENGGLD